MTESVLPPNSTPLELAMERILGERVSAVPVPIGDLWNPATCPAALLPFLAWAVSVDVWDDDWDEQVKRNVIAASFTVHQHKGTAAAVKAALAALNVGAVITEWWEEEGAQPHTFRIDCTAENLFVNGYDATTRFAKLVETQINHVKPAREHYILRVGERFESRVYARAATRSRVRQSGELTIKAAPHKITASIYVRAATHVKRKWNMTHEVKVPA